MFLAEEKDCKRLSDSAYDLFLHLFFDLQNTPLTKITMTFGFLSDCYANNNDTDAKVIPIRPLSIFMIFTLRILI